MIEINLKIHKTRGELYLPKSYDKNELKPENKYKYGRA